MRFDALPQSLPRRMLLEVKWRHTSRCVGQSRNGRLEKTDSISSGALSLLTNEINIIFPRVSGVCPKLSKHPSKRAELMNKICGADESTRRGGGVGVALFCLAWRCRLRNFSLAARNSASYMQNGGSRRVS